MQKETKRTNLLECPNNPANKEYQGHGQCHVQVGIGSTQKRVLDHEAVGCLMPPPNRAKSRDQAYPVRKQNKDKYCGEEPEGPMDEVMADNAVQEIMETLDHPFPEVLGSFRDGLHIARGDLCEDDQSQ